jgi:hypothetical protein
VAREESSIGAVREDRDTAQDMREFTPQTRRNNSGPAPPVEHQYGPEAKEQKGIVETIPKQKELVDTGGVPIFGLLVGRGLLLRRT